MRVEKLGKAPGTWQGDAILVKDKVTGNKFVVSGVNAPFTGWEVLVFRANKNGEVNSYTAVAGGKGITHDQAIADLGRVLENDDDDSS